MADEPRISSVDLLGDAEILQRAYGALHPGLLRYNSPVRLEGLWAALRAELSVPCGLAQAHLAFARATAAIRCGHSFLNPTNQTGPALELISGGVTRLPFCFRWLDGGMIVTEGRTATAALAPGTQILSIGGVPSQQLLAELLPVAHADGANDAARRRQMEVWGRNSWEAFDIYLPMLRPDLFKDGAASLLVRDFGAGRSRNVAVPLLSHEAVAANVQRRGFTRPALGALWHAEFLAGGVAWLTMPDWAVYDSHWDWRADLHVMMDTLAEDKTRALIVDLRGNVGGLDVGDTLLAHLVDRDIAKPALERRVRYRVIPADLAPYLKTWDPSFQDWGDQAVGPDRDGFYHLKQAGTDGESDLIRPHGKRFRGRVLVLIDAANASATFGFAQTVQQNGLATLIGQPTGGSRRGINGGAFFFLRLPRTGLEIDLPLIGYFPKSDEPDTGILPDVAVRASVADLANGMDVERREALRLARSG